MKCWQENFWRQIDNSGEMRKKSQLIQPIFFKSKQKLVTIKSTCHQNRERKTISELPTLWIEKLEHDKACKKK